MKSCLNKCKPGDLIVMGLFTYLVIASVDFDGFILCKSPDADTLFYISIENRAKRIIKAK